MASAALQAAVMGLTALALAACSSSAALQPADVEKQIAEGLAKQVGGDFAVTCPSPLPAETGYAFTCDVEDRTGGGALKVAVTEDDDTGTFSWRVAG